MFCPKCGKINSDTEEKCSGCGAELHEKATEETPSQKGKWLKIAFVVLAVVIVVFITVLLLNGCGTGSIPEDRITF